MLLRTLPRSWRVISPGASEMTQGALRTCALPAAFVIAAMFFLFPSPALCQGESIASVPEQSFDRRLGQDAVALGMLIRQIDETVKVMQAGGLLARGRSRDFDIGEKQLFSRLWAGYLDQMRALEAILRFYQDFPLMRQPAGRDKAFLLAYASYLARFEAALRVVGMTIDNDLYEKRLDEPHPELGIPAGMYGRLKWNTIHLKDVSTVFAGRHYYRFIEKRLRKTGLASSAAASWLFPFVDRTYAAVVKQLQQDGPSSFAANGLDIVREGMFAAWFPVQTSVAERMGDTKVKRQHATLISLSQISAMQPRLQPGVAPRLELIQQRKRVEGILRRPCSDRPLPEAGRVPELCPLPRKDLSREDGCLSQDGA